MMIVIRISGKVNLKEEIKNTLNRLRLRQKFSCILVDEKDEVKMGMIKKVRSYVAFGKIDDKLVKELKDKRGKEGKEFFRLHPPRGGFKKSSRLPAPQGILGKHKDIGKLLERML